MATNANAGNNVKPTPPSTGIQTTISGTFSGLKPPMVNGVVALINNAVVSFTAATPLLQASTTPPAAFATPAHITGDMTNGVAIANGTDVAYLTGVGVSGAVWYTLPTPPLTTDSAIVSMCGDLANGLVISDGKNILALQFSGSEAMEWTLLAAPPNPSLAVIDMAGDATNGVLLVMGPSAGGPSTLYWGATGCSCSWTPITSAGTSLPVARVQVSNITGSYANGFVILGENQLFTITTMKATAGTGSVAGSCTCTLAKVATPPPFAMTDMTGDATNGITARAAASGMIANALTPFAAWTLVNAVAPATPPATPPADQGKGGRHAVNQEAAAA